MPSASALDCGSQVCNSIKAPRRPQQQARQSSCRCPPSSASPTSLSAPLTARRAQLQLGLQPQVRRMHMRPAYLARMRVPLALAMHG
jgi:hypothetical protein